MTDHIIRIDRDQTVHGGRADHGPLGFLLPDGLPRRPVHKEPRVALITSPHRAPGLTLSMTALLKVARLLSGVRVLSNYRARSSDLAAPELRHELLTTGLRDVASRPNTLAALDMVLPMGPSRDSPSAEEDLYKVFEAQERTFFLWNTPGAYLRMFSHRTVLWTDLIMEPVIDRATGALTLHVHDYFGQWTGDFHRRRSWPAHKMEADWCVVIEDIASYYGDYDTTEIVGGGPLASRRA